jgi:molecular chaperone DnaK (HSP70)
MKEPTAPTRQAAEGEDLTHRYIIGIDLGTTNSAVAYVDLAAREDEPGNPSIQLFEPAQLVAAGEVAARLVLPSFLYLPGDYELSEGSTSLPWDEERGYGVGEFAREQGGLVPGRLVSSAKSWLCHAGVDRTAPILPWGGAEGVPKVSPVEASARYLLHIREAWNERMAEDDEESRMEEQRVILTVPASFDEVARELTIAAARQAGLSRVILVEEPLAAFYAWLSGHEQDWAKGMEAGQLVLVCDVGGGTSDFTLVAIREGEKGLRFDRLAVGDHLMLGGDNMDLALGRHLEARLMGKPGKLESKRWHQLCHQCRKAKETLLGTEDDQVSMDVVVMGTGGKLIADTLKGTLTREEVGELILEGFFPVVPLEDGPREARRTGLTEWGLPYVQDPAVSKHMGAFWKRFETLMARETGRTDLYPDFLLFNGGALTPAPVRNRIKEVVAHWFKDVAGEEWFPKELENPHPELAVAVGAAYYGLVRMGEGVRVGAGSPRAYYVDVEAEKAAGESDTRTGVCLVPRGTEEGFEVQLEARTFEVLANQPASFQLLSSSTRLGDRLGEVIDLAQDEITLFPPIRTVLRYGKKGLARKLPAQLAVRLTEVGTLDLWCQSTETPHRWQLRFDVRQDVDPDANAEMPSGEILDQAIVEKAQEKIQATFSGGGTSKEDSPERLMKGLSAALRMQKEKWPTSLIRRLSDTLLEGRKGRALSPQHEARWFNLLGYCLRPGFGDPVDEWRMKEVWKIYLQGLLHPRQVSCRSELWIFLRRVAGGLSAGHQLRVYQQLAGYFQSPGAKKKKWDSQLPKRLNAQEELEVLMALANFERLPVETKVELGRLLLKRIRKKTKPQELWTLGRLGARVPLYGPLDRVVPSGESAAWVTKLLSLGLPAREAMAQALVQMAKYTGDRERDIPEKDRQQVAEWLGQLPQADRLRELLTNPESSWEAQEQAWVFGESLPAGLSLATDEKSGL